MPDAMLIWPKERVGGMERPDYRDIGAVLVWLWCTVKVGEPGGMVCVEPEGVVCVVLALCVDYAN